MLSRPAHRGEGVAVLVGHRRHLARLEAERRGPTKYGSPSAIWARLKQRGQEVVEAEVHLQPRVHGHARATKRAPMAPRKTQALAASAAGRGGPRRGAARRAGTAGTRRAPAAPRSLPPWPRLGQPSSSSTRAREARSSHERRGPKHVALADDRSSSRRAAVVAASDIACVRRRPAARARRRRRPRPRPRRGRRDPCPSTRSGPA